MAEKECFKSGTVVEVSLDDEGFRGSWFTATVLKPSSSSKQKKKNKNKVYLEYQNLMADDGTTKLREYVDQILVRPVPPRESERSFELSEEVDAFHNEGWWEGIVISVLDDSTYSVFFRSSREQLCFRRSDLRLHREWVRGQWVPPPEQS